MALWSDKIKLNISSFCNVCRKSDRVQVGPWKTVVCPTCDPNYRAHAR